MLRLLLDEQISHVIATELRRRNKAIDVQSLNSWNDGQFLGANDEMLLVAASQENRTLVTYDLSTISRILKAWGQQDLPHAGVIFIDNKTLPSNDFGALILGLEQLWSSERKSYWTNRVVYLVRNTPEN